ncbi:unnamed protein product [Diplocarpon coronariae]
MSLTHLSGGYGGPPPHRCHHAADGDRARLPPRLPSMASLLNHEPPRDHNLQPYAGQYPPPPYGPPQPWAGHEAGSSSPAQHTSYHPAPGNSPPAQLPPPPRASPLAPDQDLHQLPRSPGGTPARPPPLSAPGRPSKPLKRRRPEPARAGDPAFARAGSHRPRASEPAISPPHHPSIEHDGPPSSRRGSSTFPASPSRPPSAQPPGPPAVPVPGRRLGEGEPRYAPPARAGQPAGPDPLGPSRKQPEPRYCLRMRQQPVAARACGFGERDRRVIDPPPILQMDVSSPSLGPAELDALMRSPYSVVHCTLWDPDTDTDATAMPGHADKRQQRRLMGTLVASPFVGRDEHGAEGCFFTFPDLSVRTPGRYSLKFALVNLVPGLMGPGQSAPIRHVIWSDQFQVFNAKDFGGMRASTELTKALRAQGCMISVKKGNGRAGGRVEDDDDDDDDDEEEEVGRRGKKSKR